MAAGDDQRARLLRARIYLFWLVYAHVQHPDDDNSAVLSPLPYIHNKGIDRLIVALHVPAKGKTLLTYSFTDENSLDIC